MTIDITQTCNGCGESRNLIVGYYGGRDIIKQAAESGGWRAVQEFRHLCSKCIAKAVHS